MNTQRWAVIFVGALLLAGVTGYFAYNAGVERAVVYNKAVAAAPAQAPYPYAYPYPYYGWHRPWGFGLFFPLFILAFLFLVMRRRWYGGRCGYGYGRDRMEQWHREMHERMKDA